MKPEQLYTHDKKGGLYRCLGVGKHKEERGEKWRPAVFYQCVTTDALYSTSPERWNDSFSLVPGPGYGQ